MIKAYIGLEKHNKKSISARISIASLNNIKEPVFAPQSLRLKKFKQAFAKAVFRSIFI